MKTSRGFLHVSGSFVVFFMAVGLAARPVWAQTTVNANWTDSTGNWTTPSNWSCNCVPNNNATNVFNVTIMPQLAIGVLLDNNSRPTNITVNSLSTNVSLQIQNGASLSVVADLTNMDVLDVDSSGSGGSSLRVGGNLTNSDYMKIGNSNMTAPTMATVAGTFTGGVYMYGGHTAGAQALLEVSGPAPSTLPGGNLELYGNAGGTAIEYTNGGITQLGDGSGGSVVLSGPNAYLELSSAPGSNSALTGLKTIATNESFSLTDGASLSTAGGITNNGSIVLNAAPGYAGTGPEMLNVGAAAPSVLTGDYEVDGNTNGAALEYRGGGITQIGDGSTQSGGVSLDGPNAYMELTGATGSNSALTGLKTIATNGQLALADGASLSTTGPLTNNGALYVDGGGRLHVGGNLTGSGYFDMFIGSTGMTSSSKVTVAGTFTSGPEPTFPVGSFGLVLTGGSVPGAQALLNVSGPAPNILTGDFYLQGNAGGAAVEYGSGSITQIAGGVVTLDGPNALIELSSAAGSNSALASLNAISETGELVLQGDASFSATGALTNRGAIEVGGYYYNGETGSALTVGGDLTNAGAVLLQRTNTLTVGAGHTYAQTAGSTDVDGTLIAPGGVKVTGGTLSGSGVVDGNVANDGIVFAGDPNAPFSKAALTIDGDYTQHADGMLVIDIWGDTHFNILDVTGKGSLDGAVDFDFLNGYVPGPNTDFAFLKAGSVAGDFTALDFVGIKCPTCTFNLSTLSLDTGSMQSAATPEPDSAFLFVIGLLGLGLVYLLRNMQRRGSADPRV